MSLDASLGRFLGGGEAHPFETCLKLDHFPKDRIEAKKEHRNLQKFLKPPRFK